MPDEPNTQPSFTPQNDNNDQWSPAPQPSDTMPPPVEDFAPAQPAARVVITPNPATATQDNSFSDSPSELLAAETEPATNNTSQPFGQPTPPPAPVVEPNAETTAPETPTTTAVPTKKRPKAKIIIGSITVLALLLIGSGVAAYNLWYQNPEKVIVDSVFSAVTAKTAIAKGTLVWENKDAKLNVKLDGKSSETVAGGNLILTFTSKNKATLPIDALELTADGVVEKNGNVYFKLTNVEKTFNAAIDAVIAAQTKSYEQSGNPVSLSEKAQLKTTLSQTYAPIIKKIDNQWIKISADSTKGSSEKTQKCTADAFDKLQSDKKTRDEINDVYMKNKFVKVKEKLGSKNGSLGYVLGFDEKAAAKFSDAVDGTALGKALKKCDSSSSSSSSSDSKSQKDVLKDARMEIWIDRWSHRMTSIKFDTKFVDMQDATLTFDGTTIFDKPVKVDVPTNTKSIDDLSSELTGAMGGTGSSSI